MEGHQATGKPRHPWARAIDRLMYQHRHQLVYVHVMMFVVFLALLIIPLFLPPPLQQDNITNNFSSFALFLIWGLWFPLVFVSVIFTVGVGVDYFVRWGQHHNGSVVGA